MGQAAPASLRRRGTRLTCKNLGHIRKMGHIIFMYVLHTLEIKRKENPPRNFPEYVMQRNAVSWMTHANARKYCLRVS